MVTWNCYSYWVDIFLSTSTIQIIVKKKNNIFFAPFLLFLPFFLLFHCIFNPFFLLSTSVSPALLLRSVRWRAPVVDFALQRPTNQAPVLTDAEAHLTNETAGWGVYGALPTNDTIGKKNNHWALGGCAAVKRIPVLFREPVLSTRLIKKSQ